MSIKNYLKFSDSLKAWEKLNEIFIRQDENLNFLYKGKALYLYDLVVEVENPVFPGDFDFGRHFNYTISKWANLIKNYIDKKELEEVRKEVQQKEKKKKPYSVSFSFSNNHKHGKSCLLSMVCSKRVDGESVITLFLRSSEVTKRLACDLLLFNRIGDFIYGGNKYKVVVYFNQIFNDDTVLLMYHVHKDVFKVLKKSTNNERVNILSYRLKQLLSIENISSVKYKVHRRALKVLKPDLVKYPTTLARECVL